MTVLTLRDVSLAYGHRPLLDHVDFDIAAGDRVCVVGRNGTGKSTLFKVLSGATVPDDGEVWRRDTLRIAHLEQEVPAELPGTVFEVVAAGLGELGALLTAYHRCLSDIVGRGAAAMEESAMLQQRIDAMDGWNLDQKVETVLSRLSLPADAPFNSCSGGIRRQVMLARALVVAPDLLLLDEPTNHMDITAIRWLEDFLMSYQGALMFITHDRSLLKRLATRIVDLDRGRLTSFPGDYDNYLSKKDSLFELEQQAIARFDKKLAEHEAWLRQGIKARRTRNEGRVRALEAMRRVRSRRLTTPGQARIDVDGRFESGKLVFDVCGVNFRYGANWVVHDFSTRILRGDRVGVIGPNGSGKTTLLKLLLGQIQPESGHVSRGARVQLAYFDQQRAQLDMNKSVREVASDGSDYLAVQGRQRHVISYLKDFLFPPERIDSPVKSLSGGERNRLLLAKMFTRPANVMVLDEPTNDLDVETLELLEELLSEFAGTLLLVSHDRTFIDNVVTNVLVLEGDGNIQEFIGGVPDRLGRLERSAGVQGPAQGMPAKAARPVRTQRTAAGSQKLTYHEQQELLGLPSHIEAMEAERQQLEREVITREFYRQEKNVIIEALARLQRIKDELARSYERWDHLEVLASPNRTGHKAP